jgi:hypothetical protein
MRRKQPETLPADARLCQVLFCIREGLRKLIPAAPNWGHPPFTRYCTPNSEHREQFDPTCQPHLVVDLHAWYSTHKQTWICSLSIADGDDFLLQRFRPFTWEDWQSQVDLYDQVTSFDDDMCSLLRDAGFS